MTGMSFLWRLAKVLAVLLMPWVAAGAVGLVVALSAHGAGLTMPWLVGLLTGLLAGFAFGLLADACLIYVRGGEAPKDRTRGPGPPGTDPSRPCPQCGYDRRADPAGACPECGNAKRC